MRNTMSKIAVVAVITGLAALTEAAVVVQKTGQNAIYTVATNDLLQTRLSSVSNSLTLNVGENYAAGGKTYVVLNNGVFGAADKTQSVVIASGTITYNLDTSANTLGYDITNISTYAGWADFNRGSQAYTVSYSVVGDAGFTDLATVTLYHDGLTQEKCSITETAGGILASRVDAIRFTFPAQEFGGVGYKEIDVTGTPVTVKPSLLIFGWMGGLGNGHFFQR